MNAGVMLPSASKPPPVVVLGNPGTRRANLFQAALARLHLPPAQVVAYADLLAGRVCLNEVVPPGALVRIESPDKDRAVEHAILALGAEPAARDGCEYLDRQAVARLDLEPGRMLPSRQWYLGWCVLLEQITAQLAACPPHRLMNHPAEIAVMFDKPRCHALLQSQGIAVPRSLGAVGSYDELLTRMLETGLRRVFVKPAHGSSASGVVAYQVQGHRHQATTTVELVRCGDAVALYNSKRMQVYHDPQTIATLIDALCRQRVQVEQWLPKAGLAQRTFDLRVVVIAGQVQHTVVRLSRSPITNLHLDNERATPDLLLTRMPPEAWQAIRVTCMRAMQLFPRSLYAGIDLLVQPGFHKHAILEMNAFGDLLLDVVHDGIDTYTAEIIAALELSGEQENRIVPAVPIEDKAS